MPKYVQCSASNWRTKTAGWKILVPIHAGAKSRIPIRLSESRKQRHLNGISLSAHFVKPQSFIRPTKTIPSRPSWIWSYHRKATGRNWVRGSQGEFGGSVIAVKCQRRKLSFVLGSRRIEEAFLDPNSVGRRDRGALTQ